MSPSPATAPVLAVHGLSKSFGGTQALAGLSLEVLPGEVHGLLGQNGSGKSTLIKLLSGYHQPDGGSVEVGGAAVHLPLTLAQLREAGVGFVHQDLGLVDSMSVLDNMRIGRYETGPGRRIRWAREQAGVRELLRRFALDVDPAAPAGRLSRAEQTIVAIMRALQDVEHRAGASLLVLDEPTAALPAHEAGMLFEAVREVVRGGCAVLFVTHDIDEVFQICDRVSVLRDGRRVATEPIGALDPASLVRLIVGRDLSDLYPAFESEPDGVVLEVDGLSGGLVHDVSFEVRKGEVLGLTGLVGAGHEDVPYLVYGAAAPTAGEVRLEGESLGALDPRRARDAGLALLPADRARQSGIPKASVAENVTLPALREFFRGLRLRGRAEREAVEAVLEELDVNPRDPGRRLETLSGGNQQKALLGRWLRLSPRVLLLHEPTQGVDVGARAGIFSILRDAVSAGSAVVYASAEYEDLVNVCDRVLVFRRGRVVADLSGAALTHSGVVDSCYGGVAV